MFRGSIRELFKGAAKSFPAAVMRLPAGSLQLGITEARAGISDIHPGVMNERAEISPTDSDNPAGQPQRHGWNPFHSNNFDNLAEIDAVIWYKVVITGHILLES